MPLHLHTILESKTGWWKVCRPLTRLWVHLCCQCSRGVKVHILLHIRVWFNFISFSVLFSVPRFSNIQGGVTVVSDYQHLRYACISSFLLTWTESWNKLLWALFSSQDLAQNKCWWWGFQLIQSKDPALFQGEIITE